jgi:hypothetical protein
MEKAKKSTIVNLPCRTLDDSPIKNELLRTLALPPIEKKFVKKFSTPQKGCISHTRRAQIPTTASKPP